MSEGKREVRDRRYFKARRGLTYLVNDADIAAILRGDTKPDCETRRVEAGEIVQDLPACEVEGFLRIGAIEETDRPPTRVVRQKEADDGGSGTG